MVKLIYTVMFALCCMIAFTHCSRDESIPSLSPNAGIDQLELVTEGYLTTIAANTLEDGQTGTWKVVRGEGGIIDDIHLSETIFRGEPGQLYTLEWEVREGDMYSTDWMDISFQPMEVNIYNVLPDTVKDSFTIHFEADSALYGAQGTWSLVGEDSTSGSFSDVHHHMASFTGLPEHTYIVQWTHQYGGTQVSKQMEITFDTLYASAGEDQLGIVTREAPYFFTLEGHLQEGATGEWTILEGNGGNVVTNHLPNSLFQGERNELYTLEWKVMYDNEVKRDTVKLSFGGLHHTWIDPLDNKEYKTVQIGDVEWMAQNYDLDEYVGIAAWYYGQAAEAENHTGHVVSSDEDRRIHGKLYSYTAAELLAPEGWRLPTYEEWWDLVEQFEGQNFAGDHLRAGGKSGIELTYSGYFEMPSYRNQPQFGDMEMMGRYWVKLPEGQTIENSFPQAFQINEGSLVGIGIFIPHYALSVRYIRDVQN
ncbi:hypothetical protein KMW28_21965 [Flammeovirga yaeyamensis]|uniref:Fibrobacter succinogenes major paralogous domain-containing protein n=1 Tax=Flammeovirga yaeyamensis TaxID=367791 RepID=A0AAX1NBZ2_9BACT|nr:FISUMP domain-containing protein [Flammeovirga yaeyamensis]MBB3696977.1 uncharacterized protein (TIGR02145 family) [Flammeovirga yaeyamensis]NMF33640.1 hypothetical protein [Flammeovirga yaeyamensis]QWG05094.1 hypothetical protein KMW28_21965 [Flammeovirga yaeyamensis]